MKFNYNLNLDDYLNYQLFNASQTKSIIKKRKRNRFIPAIFFVVLGIVPRFDFTETFTLIYIFIGILWIFVYPIWDKRWYFNYYKKYIKENYVYNFDKDTEVIITMDEILMKNENSESRISLAELKEINEIPLAFYLKLKSSQSIILPKNKMSDLKEFREILDTIKNKYSINYNEFPQWKWQ
ncbi:YcxB family protein [Chryseobacterium sp. MYb264]|uniref:YcxB family protein n=1 Tax=Chryseobacterium sp. MYb264 TaxID=2745153 RepID=UPI002E13F1D9|nr:YcxB family protein [Chryseobacterium sp. MYb264]